MAKTKVKTKKLDASGVLAVDPQQKSKTGRLASWRRSRTDNLRLPSVFRLSRDALSLIARHWKVFLVIMLIYGVLNHLLAQSLSTSGTVVQAKTTLDELFTGAWNKLAGSITIFGYLIGSPNSDGSSSTGIYQLTLALIISLAIIWVLRQAYTGRRVRARDGFYQGMAPLIPFVLVLAFVLLELIPMAIGLMLYGAVTVNGIAVGLVEQLIWALLAFGTTILSLYLLSSSLFALYIVTLPGMTPLKALRSAKQLVIYRRWTVIRKVIFLPVALLVLLAILVVPVIMLATPLAAWLFYVLLILVLPVAHSYMYTLYRALI